MSIWRRGKGAGEAVEGPLSPQESRAQEAEFEDLSEHGYLRVSRSLSASILFALPLVLVYELGVLLVQNDVNAVAVWVKTPMSWLRRHPAQILGTTATLILNGVFILAILQASYSSAQIPRIAPVWVEVAPRSVQAGLVVAPRGCYAELPGRRHPQGRLLGLPDLRAVAVT